MNSEKKDLTPPPYLVSCKNVNHFVATPYPSEIKKNKQNLNYLNASTHYIYLHLFPCKHLTQILAPS